MIKYRIFDGGVILLPPLYTNNQGRLHGALRVCDINSDLAFPFGNGIITASWNQEIFWPASSFIISSMRQEKPHSLSYQENTFTRVPPITIVESESNTDE